MKTFLLGLVLCFVGFAGNAQALNSWEQEPPASLIVTSGGLEWVWASGCAYNATDIDVCGHFHFHHNFAVPTAEQWNMGFSSLAALIEAFIPSSGADMCAANYFVEDGGHHNFCNPEDIMGDAQFGIPAGGVYGAPFFSTDPLWQENSQYAEQFLVRAVPEPESLILLGIGLFALAAWRRKGLAH